MQPLGNWVRLVDTVSCLDAQMGCKQCHERTVGFGVESYN